MTSDGEGGRTMDVYSFKVTPFKMGTEKEAALKPLEEAAEAFGAWQMLDGCDDECDEDAMADQVIMECCDTIQAACNLAYRAGATEKDMARMMDSVHQRNEARGRYADR